MQDWTYVGTAAFGSDPGVSLAGYTFNEVLAVAKIADFNVYFSCGTPSSEASILFSTPSMEFYWIPELGEAQLAKSFIAPRGYNPRNHTSILITVLFNSSYVRVYKARVVNPTSGGTTNYNTSAHGSLDIYCR